MPFVIFENKEDHTKALDLIMQIQCANENLPLEKRVSGFITSFEGKSQLPHTKVYFFPIMYVYAFNNANIECMVIMPQEVGQFLSSKGKYNLMLVKKYRPSHINDPKYTPEKK